MSLRPPRHDGTRSRSQQRLERALCIGLLTGSYPGSVRHRLEGRAALAQLRGEPAEVAVYEPFEPGRWEMFSFQEKGHFSGQLAHLHSTASRELREGESWLGGMIARAVASGLLSNRQTLARLISNGSDLADIEQELTRRVFNTLWRRSGFHTLPISALRCQ